MSRRLAAWALALALVAVGFVLGVLATPLSGGTVLGVLLICSGFWWLIGLTAPRTHISLNEACELLDEQRRAGRRQAEG